MLPPDAQREAIDFIDFLKGRYVKNNKDQQESPLAIPIEKEAFVGIWKNREDLQDSSAWVKQIRESDWK